jgi:transcriptional regulator with XRE-family HTH domain
MTLTGARVAQARVLLGWSVSRLAREAGLDYRHLDAFECGTRRMSTLDLSVLKRVLETAGARFSASDEAPGVRLKVT